MIVKFVLFAVVVAVIWYLSRLGQRAEIERLAAGGARRKPPDGRIARGQVRATDTTVCSRCGTYVPTDFPTACSRNDCPFPRAAE